jgi:outer membrane protein TolC
MTNNSVFKRSWAGDSSRGSSFLVKASAVLFCLALSASGPGYAGKVVWSGVPQIKEEANLQINDGSIELSLGDAVTIALERNLALNVQRYSQESARFGIQQSRGIYDLAARATLSTGEETTPRTSNLDGASVQTSERMGWNFGLSQLLASGGNVSVDWNNSRFESNSLFATVNPSFRTDLDFSLVQPLMKGAGKRATERNIIVAENNLDISRESFELQVTSTIQQVENAYWTLVEALEQLKVAEESLALAKQLHEQNRIRVEVGTLAPLELIQSEAGVATRDEQIIRARAAVGDGEDVLRQLLNLDREGHWNTPILPVTDPAMNPAGVDLQAAIETALRERPEITSKMLAIKNQEIDVDFFRNQRKPQLDLNVTYGANGVGGPITERDFLTGEILSQSPGGYSDALDQITKFDFDGWSAALNLAVPVQNRAARAQSTIATVALERGMAELEDLELQVITEVRRVARAVMTSEQVIRSAQVSRNLEEKNLDAEQKRYQNGMSTSFQVLQIQEDLTEARSREVNAITGYRKALALFYQATGQLIAESGFEFGEQ